MNRIQELITTSLKYYDINNFKHEKIFKKVKYYSLITSSSDIAHNIIIFYDKNDKEIFRSRYEYLGMYDSQLKLWIWGWAIPYSEKNTILLSKKLLLYALDLIPSDELMDLKLELITSRFVINHPIQLDIHAAIASYISKNVMTFKLIKDMTKEEEYEKNAHYEITNDINDQSYVFFMYLLDEDGIKSNPDNI